MKLNNNRIQKLNEYPSYKGGDTCLHESGYIFEYAPRHPLANSWGWVAQHRLVAETKIGRPLVLSKDHGKREVAHHVNHIKTDNRLENIQVMTSRQHSLHHARCNADALLSKLTEDSVRTALHNRTIREAAAVLGTTHMTIRRRFPELIAGRKRRTPADVHDPKWPDLIRPLAADPSVTMKDAVQVLGISAIPIRRICLSNGIKWIQNLKRNGVGFGRPKGSKVLDVTDKKWLKLVPPLAADPLVTMAQACRILGIGEAQLRNIRSFHGIAWESQNFHLRRHG